MDTPLERIGWIIGSITAFVTVLSLLSAILFQIIEIREDIADMLKEASRVGVKLSADITEVQK